MQGQILWLEVPVTDLARAQAFYTDVLGWECNKGEGKPSNLSGTESVHFFSKGVMNGAFHKRAEAGVDAARPGAVTTFMVDSIEETLGKVGQKGGKTLV
jgi:predicted enzyme related to lactoylglutathione lyase